MAIRDWFEVKLWKEDLRRVQGARRWGLAVLRVVAHVAVSFGRNLAQLQAAGLTLVTLLALVPLLALVFAIANAFGADYGARVQTALLELGGELPDGMQGVLEQVRLIVDNTSFAAMGLFGTMILIWSAFALFTRVEGALNHVWRAGRRRSWYRRLVDFIALVVLVPPLVLAGLFLHSMVTSADALESLRQEWEWLAWFYQASLGFLPHVMLWIAFGALYKAMPSVRVTWKAAAVAGVCAGSAWVALLGIYVRFQIGVAHANAIYATLAALPLLLIYLQLTWTIVLAGAEISYAIQNLHTLRGTEHLPEASHTIRKRLAWHLVHGSAEAFRAGAGGMSLSGLATRLDVPREWIDVVVEELVAAGVLLQVVADHDRVVPGRPPDMISFAQVCLAAEGGDRAGFLDRVRLPVDKEEYLEQGERALGDALAARF